MTPRSPARASNRDAANPRSTAIEKLTRTEIITTALEVLDEHGLPNLSMRRISDYLDVQPSALYWHFANKQSLLAGVSDRILLPLVAQTPRAAEPGCTPQEGTGHAPQAEHLRTLALQLRAALLSRRDGAELVSSSFALDLLAVDLIELTAKAAATDFGLDARARLSCAEAVVHYTIGQAFHEQQRSHAIEVGALGASSTHPDRFISGLDLIIAGATTLARRAEL